jgi:hypothetical protein
MALQYNITNDYAILLFILSHLSSRKIISKVCSKHKEVSCIMYKYVLSISIIRFHMPSSNPSVVATKPQSIHTYQSSGKSLFYILHKI